MNHRSPILMRGRFQGVGKTEPGVNKGTVMGGTVVLGAAILGAAFAVVLLVGAGR